MLRLLVLSALSFVVGTAGAQNAARGQQIAGQVCAACHAADGNSVAAANPKIAGQFAEYLKKQLGDFKAQPGKKPARESAIMTAMAANLSDDDIQSVAAYYAGQKLRPASAVDKDLVAQGQKIWRGGIAPSNVPACGGCHGPAGAGIPVQYPRLAGQFAEYVAAQLKGFKDGARSNDPNGIMRGVAARMTDREIQAVAQYAAGLR
ncbi:MAG TPA: c-type cytochrome [Burkholderiales bacterium]|jgi:cytochrome c553